MTQSPHASDPSALAIIDSMRRRSPKADPLSLLPDIHPSRIPRHIAIIMDGNGRWAMDRGFPRMVGHRGGAAAVREIVDEAGRLGIEALTLYSFSLENWKRPKEEIDALMQLCMTYLDGEREHLKRENIRFKVIGRRRAPQLPLLPVSRGVPAPAAGERGGGEEGAASLPDSVIRAIEEVEQATAHCTGPTLCLAINYGSRAEITDAVRAIAAAAKSGTLDPREINESTIAEHLYTSGLPDPDLLIRTAGEMRISNYLLWQISYAELYITDCYWPDFGRPQLHEAIRVFAGRRRRFGGLDSTT
jgi:undecaprenyl diphosphate synthase